MSSQPQMFEPSWTKLSRWSVSVRWSSTRWIATAWSTPRVCSRQWGHAPYAVTVAALCLLSSDKLADDKLTDAVVHGIFKRSFHEHTDPIGNVHLGDQFDDWCAATRFDPAATRVDGAHQGVDNDNDFEELLATLRSGRRPVGHLPSEKFLAPEAVWWGSAYALAKQASSRCRQLGACDAGERVYHHVGHLRASRPREQVARGRVRQIWALVLLLIQSSVKVALKSTAICTRRISRRDSFWHFPQVFWVGHAPRCIGSALSCACGQATLEVLIGPLVSEIPCTRITFEALHQVKVGSVTTRSWCNRASRLWSLARFWSTSTRRSTSGKGRRPSRPGT